MPITQWIRQQLTRHYERKRAARRPLCGPRGREPDGAVPVDDPVLSERREIAVEPRLLVGPAERDGRDHP